MSKHSHSHAPLIVTAFLAVFIVGSLQLLASLTYPQWWQNRNVVNINALSTNDYAAANLGQLKWFTTNACAELEQFLSGGAGSNLQSMVASFSTSNNFSAITVGQLKYTASGIYDRLMEEGITNAPPWTTNTVADDSDYAIANLGQLKHVFNFDLTCDTDSDGMLDQWEMEYFGDLDETANGDPDSDGLINQDEYIFGSNPQIGLINTNFEIFEVVFFQPEDI